MFVLYRNILISFYKTIQVFKNSEKKTIKIFQKEKINVSFKYFLKINQ